VAGELKSAMDAYGERVKSTGGPGPSDVDEVTVLVSGFDLDPAERARCEEAIADHACGLYERGAELAEIAAGVWVNGLLLGLLIADRRARAVTS